MATRLGKFELPNRLVKEEDTSTDTYAKFIADPFESGYGHTIGNAFRRVLLSSIEGAAISSLKLDGVQHEFQSIDGVVEDVTDIVLNVKSLALKCNSEGAKKLVLDAKGPGEIKASDITPVSDVEILNPDLVIIQAGADCLADDPQSKMSLSNFSYWNAISKLKDITKKTLILGGGGYNPYITAKAWAGNWLVLNDKEYLLDTVINEECRDLLKSLHWKNSRVREGIPKKWLENWLDKPKISDVRDDIKRLLDEINKIKNF